MHKTLAIGIAVCTLLFGQRAGADEGMWTFDGFPAAAVQRAYGFSPGADFLTRLRLGSITLSGCSASFVSSQGLVATNHHCVRDCLVDLSRPGQDLVPPGFYAATQADEVKCPGLDAKQLIAITPVTEQVRAAMAGKQGRALADAERATIAAIAKACSTSSDIRCEVIKLYHGGRYALYKYRFFDDVRMVFAPEAAISDFGGDPDNFEFPRYGFDISFLRIYEAGKPLETTTFFPFARADVHDGQLVFSVGSPQQSNRQMTAAELEFVRDYSEPRWLTFEAEERGLLTEFQKRGPDATRVSAGKLADVANFLKNDRAQIDSLLRSSIIKDKRAAEAALQARIDADPKKRALYGGSWDAVAATVAKYRDGAGLRYELLENAFGFAIAGSSGGMGFNTRLAGLAKTLVRLAEETAKPDGERLSEFNDAALPAQRLGVLADTLLSDDLETAMLAQSLSWIREYLGPDDADVKVILGKSSPEALAAALVTGTALKDVAYRRTLLDGGKAAIDASQDPLIVFMRRIDPRLRAIRRVYDDEIAAPLTRYSGLIADATFEIGGTSTYPDATQSPRISFGTVTGLKVGDRTIAATTFVAGLYDRATDADPFRLPPAWTAAQGVLDPATVFNFATTQDTLSGNSGSPVIDEKGRFVGILFDGNIYSIGGNFGYDGALNRAVGLGAPVIREALAKVYKASRLLAEIDRDAQ